MNPEKTAANLEAWLQEQVQNAHAKGLVVGLSGGIDSAVVAAVAKRAFPENLLTIIMPCHSDSQDAEDALLTAKALGLNVKTVDLTPVYDQFFAQVGINPDDVPTMARANVKPRLRMITVYLHAALHNYLVMGTGNKDELHVGYFTKHGDGGADLLPLGGLVKSEVRELARYLKVPEPVITKAPSAGLWQGQTDEAEMGFGYDELDRFLQGGTVSESVRERINQLHAVSEHKRRPIPVGPAAID